MSNIFGNPPPQLNFFVKTSYNWSEGDKMKLVKVGDSKYITVARLRYVRKGRKERIEVHLGEGGGDKGELASYVILEGQEALNFIHWLDTNSEDVS